MKFQEAMLLTITTKKFIFPSCNINMVVYYDSDFDIIYCGTKLSQSRMLDVPLVLNKALLESNWNIVENI